MSNKKQVISLIILSILFLSIGLPVLADIVISSFSPTEINVGDQVTISGSGFGATQAGKSVKFFAGPADPSEWLDASVSSWSDSVITVTAPTYALTGSIKVVSGIQEGVSPSPITIKPKVTSAVASPSSVTVKFDNYMDGVYATDSSNYTLVSDGSTIDLSSAWMEFRGHRVTIKNISLTVNDSFTVTVGSAVKSLGGTAIDSNYNSASGTVVQGPAITGISPSSGSVGDTITISGTNFGATQDQSKVYFSAGEPTGGAPPSPVEAASYPSWSDTSIEVVVPTGAKGGPVFVVVNGIESDFNPNTFFDIKGNFQYKIQDSQTSADIGSTNGRIVIGTISGPALYYVGDTHSTSYNSGTGVFTVPNVSSMGWAWALDASGDHVTGSGQEIDITQTVTFSLDSSTRKISGSITGAGANREIVIWSDPIEETGTGMEWREPIFVRTDSNGDTTYNIGLPAAGKYIVGVEDPGFKTGTSSSPKVAPSPREVDVTGANATGIDFAFTAATARIHGKIEKAEGKTFTTGPGADVFHVFAYEPKENGFHASAMPDTNTLEFDLYVNPGIYIVEVGGPGVPFIVEEKIEVKTGDPNFALTDSTTDITLKIKAPEDFIEGTVKDSGGNGIPGASIFAWSETGPGWGEAFTDSSGYYKLYLTPGTYSVEGFTPQYGKLSRRTGIVVSSASHPTVDFSVSSEMATISGTVTKGGSALANADVWITEGEFGWGVNGTRTDSSGVYSLRVPYTPAGTTYWLHIAKPGIGELYRGAITTTLDKDTTSLTQNVSINTATITVKISPKSAFDKAFVGIHGTGTTKGGGFSENDVSSAGDTFRQYSIEVPRPASGNYTYIVEGGIPNYGPLPANMTVDGTPQSNHNITVSSTTTSMTIEFTLGTVYTISGTISDPDAATAGNQAEGAWVWAASSSGHGGGEVDSNGNFSFKVPAGTYDIGIDKPGYVGNMIVGADVTSGNYSVTSGALTLTQTTSTITGTVTGSGPLSEAWVWATNGTGGWAGAKTNGDGEFTLNVGSGDWTIKAIGEGYSERSPLTIGAGSSGVSLDLSAVSGYTAPVPKVEPITPKDGGIVQGENVKVEAPAGALGTDTESGWLTIEETTNLPTTNSFKPLAGKGKTITAKDNSKTKITTLSSEVTIDMTYTASDLQTAGITQDTALDLSLGYWNSITDTWTAIPTTAVPDSAGTGVTYTATTKHLSDFAPLVPSGANPPDTPTGLTSVAGDSQVNLQWAVSSGATKYYVYRKSDSTYPYLGQTTVTNYTDTGLTNGTTYCYKVSALNADNDESAATSAECATPVAIQGGLVLDTIAPSISQIEASVDTNSATISWKTDESSISWIVYGQTTDYGEEIKTTAYTTSHSQVLSDLSPVTTYHYQIKSKDSAGNIGSSDDKTFTTLTVEEVPVEEVPEEEKVEEITIPTLEKPVSEMTIEELESKIAEFLTAINQLKALLAELKVVPEIEGIPADFKFETNLRVGEVSDDIKYLQIFLNSDPDTQLATEGPGSPGNETTYFGPLTKAAVIKFQEKYTDSVLAPWGITEGTGLVGTTTRAKLNELLGR